MSFATTRNIIGRYLAFFQQYAAQQTTPKGSGKTNHLGSLMKTSIGFLPVEDPHPEEMSNNGILKNLIIQGHVLLGIPNHIHPERVVVVEFGKGIIGPSRMPLKELCVLFPRKDSVPPTTIKYLVLRQYAF